MMIKMILPAMCFNDGMCVLKIAGEKKYKLRKKVKIYDSTLKEIEPEKGSVFLVDDQGNINQVNGCKPLAAFFEVEEAIEFLQLIQVKKEEVNAV